MAGAIRRSLPFARLTPDDPGNPCINEVRTDGTRFACVADDGRVRVGSFAERRLRLDGIWTPDGPRVLANAVARRGEHVVIGSHEHRLVQFSDREGEGSQTAATNLGLGPINSLAIICDDMRILVGTYSGAIAVVRPDGEVQSKLDIGAGAIKAIAVDPAEEYVAIGTADGTIVRWKLDAESVDELTRHQGIVNDISMSVDGSTIASVSRDFSVRVTNLMSGLTEAVIALPKRSPKSVVNLGRGWVLVGDYWGGLLLVDLVQGSVTRHILATNGISSLACAGTLVLASSYDGSLNLVDPSTCTPVDTLRLMVQKPHTTAPSSDGT